MYSPKEFIEEDIGVLQDVMRAHGWAILVGSGAGSPEATHLPFMLDETRGENGTLVSHMAKANPHWQNFEKDGEVLVIFWGPHAYISPGWYEKQPAVPTWNYVTVHAYGTPRLIEGEEAMIAAQSNLVAAYEGAEGWKLKDQPEKFIKGMLAGIVTFEIPISRLEGKFKMSQNRPSTDIPGIMAGLRHRARGDDIVIADMLED
jgi:transcriptional regulator